MRGTLLFGGVIFPSVEAKKDTDELKPQKQIAAGTDEEQLAYARAAFDKMVSPERNSYMIYNLIHHAPDVSKEMKRSESWKKSWVESWRRQILSKQCTAADIAKIERWRTTLFVQDVIENTYGRPTRSFKFNNQETLTLRDVPGFRVGNWMAWRHREEMFPFNDFSHATVFTWENVGKVENAGRKRKLLYHGAHPGNSPGQLAAFLQNQIGAQASGNFGQGLYLSAL